MDLTGAKWLDCLCVGSNDLEPCESGKLGYLCDAERAGEAIN